MEEISEILSSLDVQIRSLLDFPEIPEIEESGATLKENALGKARAGFRSTGLPSLADDSGLEVFHLNGQPGVHSARFAGETATYDDNNKKLLAALRAVPPEQRTARFRCVIAFVAEETEQIAEGVCQGSIATTLRGTGGFGYDPLFVPDGFLQTYAQLTPDIKNRVSHRGKALASMKKFLTSYYRKRS